MKRLIEKITTGIFNRLWYYLKNRKSLKLSREEIRYLKASFSQFGEDLAVSRWASRLHIESGTYLDIGAFHPSHLSNTLLLHKRGWTGVNIDMNPGKIRCFDLLRPNDENICCAVSSGNSDFLIIDAGGPTERISPLPDGLEADPDNIIKSRKLQDILAQTRLANGRIDYINIDCEGHDFEVLKQVDFELHDVSILTVEALDEASRQTIVDYMTKQGFCLTDKLHWTLLFVRVDRIRNATSLS